MPLEGPGVLPGTHWINVDSNDIIWGSENWAHNIWRLDPNTEEFTRIPWKVTKPINSPAGGNYAVDPDGFMWRARDTQGLQDRRADRGAGTGYVLKKFPGTYGSAMSHDGRYFGGGAWPRDGVVVVDTRPPRCSSPTPARGSRRRAASSTVRQLLGGRPRRLPRRVQHDRKAHPRIQACRRPTSRSIPPRPTRTARCGPAKCMPAVTCASIRRQCNGPNTCCRNLMAIDREIVDRQLDRSGDGLVRGPRGLSRAHPAARLSLLRPVFAGPASAVPRARSLSTPSTVRRRRAPPSTVGRRRAPSGAAPRWRRVA